MQNTGIEPGGVIAGEDTWSESAMVLYFDPQLRNGFSFRISRFPERGATWVWCHVVHEGVLYSYTDPRLACTTDKVDPDQPAAIYDVPGATFRISRNGPSRALQSLSFSAQFFAHRSEGGVDGPGDVAVSLEGTFHPGNLRSGSPAGRFERTGRVDATVEVAGRGVSLSGLAKAHEQTQTRPRFGGPFTYAMLWGPTASLVALMAKERKYGNYEADGDDRPIDGFAIERWAPTRAFVAVLDNGQRISGKATTLYKYQVPVFSRMWQGRIVAAEIGSHRMVGMINDWRAEEQSYGIA